MNPRQKAKDLITLAVADRTPDAERLAAALQAARLISKHDLLSTPPDDVIDTGNNETAQAALNIFDRLTDPEFVRNVKKITGSLGRKRRR